MSKFESYCKSVYGYSYQDHFLSRPLLLVSVQHNGYRTANIPTTEVWLACRRPTTSIERVERSILALKVSNINRERWYATIIGFLGKKGFKWWNNLPISKQEENKNYPNKVFKAIANTLEVSTSYWNHINEMYSNIKQGEHESTDQLDQCIKRSGRKMPVQNWRWENGM